MRISSGRRDWFASTSSICVLLAMLLALAGDPSGWRLVVDWILLVVAMIVVILGVSGIRVSRSSQHTRSSGR